ncbi:hypothetical protein [Nesterenkonia sphaerica]|uniref:Mur ligase central domain-containing protein n=1 Tax=Nesterenkonia sphaerica TaxID=1804988 RepID=A0A5R9AAG7_9MICC|nr:hypothetical protein [Nesterenkonia sphaerica]TLP75520.1 hypothetical protein FEF27_07640 [Nesterenkonia sphaerica]
MTTHDAARLGSVPRADEQPPQTRQSLPELEEQVVFSEWRALRRKANRSLPRMRALMRVLDYTPEKATPRIIGVVGSKGKGTAAAYASAAAASRGMRVVTVMSPGVLSNADRIRINGVPAGKDLRGESLQALDHARQQLPAPTDVSGYLAPTGLFLLMGFLIAERVGADLVVAEAGIGGASDDLSHWPLETVVVTSIFGEHLDLLGPTVEDVARDKSAVITASTRRVVCCPQSAEVQAIIEQRCRRHGAELLSASGTAGTWLPQVVSHLPEGFARGNAAAGVLAGLYAAGEDVRLPAQDLPQLGAAAQSVHYPGRLSVHQVPPAASMDQAAPRRCVVDSAVSQSGLRAALDFAESALAEPAQVLVSLPPGKDLPGFLQELKDRPGRKVFVELPGAYTGTPDRSAWPAGPEWDWITLGDVGGEAVHLAAASEQLLSLLRERDSLAVGTVLFTSLVLRSLGAQAQQLFNCQN